MNVKLLNKITMNDCYNVFEEFEKEGLLFKCNFEQLSKHFLNKFMKVNAFSVDFKAILSFYIENINDENQADKDLLKAFNLATLQKNKNKTKNIPVSEKEFYQYICKTYFNLIKEPQTELLSAFEKARKDIISIDKNLCDIEEKMDNITRNNDALEIQTQKPMLYFYKELNEKAKQEILDFLKRDIYTYSLRNCRENQFFYDFFSKHPYSYCRQPNSFKPQPPNDLKNKLSDMILPEFTKINVKYRENKPAFYDDIEKYIKTNKIVNRIKELIKSHHLLDLKKEIITEALITYDQGSKIMFVNAVPTIIEGLLYDLCLLIGEDENILLQKGFQYKLDYLQKHLNYELHYEYYSFRFRIFRNKVAHGRLTTKDVDELSDLLLLDLHHICNLLNNKELKLIQRIKTINMFNDNNSTPNYHYILQYLLLNDVDIPDFYNLNTQIIKLENCISSEKFWEFLENEIDTNGESGKHGIFTILKQIKRRKQLESKCKKLLKKIAIKKVNNDLANSYLKNLFY